MTEHVVEISARPAHLRLHLENLVVESAGAQLARIPLAELAAVIVSHNQATVSLAAMDGMASSNVAFVVCDARHQPSGMLLPLAGNYVQAERFRRQAALALPTQKQLWKQIVQAKITAQARALVLLNGSDAGLTAIARSVRSGDTGNAEARAAIRYWRSWLPEVEFARDPDGSGPNAHLNYGYAVLRAFVARAIAGAGLHPSLGLHHHNRYNAFCLADDLMEPYRPLVDVAVANIARSGEPLTELLPIHKQALIQSMQRKFSNAGESRGLSDWLGQLAQSLVKVIMGERRNLEVPEL